MSYATDYTSAKEKPPLSWGFFFGAGTGTQTLGLFLGKEALYQLSYTRA
jgi:hypothetical protein